MAEGTKYTDKDNLITAIIGYVFPNKGRKVLADNLQTSLRDIVESLWNKGTGVSTLTITDENVSKYVQVSEGYSGIAGLYIRNVPDGTTHISVETTVSVKIFGVSFVTAIPDGSRVTLIGNIELREPVAILYPEDGRFTAYLYNYLGGVDGDGPTPTAGSTNALPDKGVEVYRDFMYWNGTWYHRGY